MGQFTCWDAGSHLAVARMSISCKRVSGVSATGRSLVQRIPSVCVCVSLGVIRHNNYPTHLQGLGKKWKDTTLRILKLVLFYLSRWNWQIWTIVCILFTSQNRITIASVLRADISMGKNNLHRRTATYIRDKFCKENREAFLYSRQIDLQFCYLISSLGYEKHFCADCTYTTFMQWWSTARTHHRSTGRSELLLHRELKEKVRSIHSRGITPCTIGSGTGRRYAWFVLQLPLLSGELPLGSMMD
jgi:hypothetical protein